MVTMWLLPMVLVTEPKGTFSGCGTASPKDEACRIPAARLRLEHTTLETLFGVRTGSI